MTFALASKTWIPLLPSAAEDGDCHLLVSPPSMAEMHTLDVAEIIGQWDQVQPILLAHIHDWSGVVNEDGGALVKFSHKVLEGALEHPSFALLAARCVKDAALQDIRQVTAALAPKH